jgi:hypothetical protein
MQSTVAPHEAARTRQKEGSTSRTAEGTTKRYHTQEEAGDVSKNTAKPIATSQKRQSRPKEARDRGKMLRGKKSAEARIPGAV